MGSKILTFPMPAMGAQELCEDLTNGNTHTCRAFRMTEPKSPSREKGAYSHVCCPKRGGKASSEDVWRSCLLCCLKLTGGETEKQLCPPAIFAAPLGLQLPRENVSYRATCQTHPKDLFDGSEILGNVVAVLCHVYS